MKAQVHNYRAWMQGTDPIALANIFDNLLEESGHKVIRYVSHHWQPYGFTCLYLLSESHLAVHTWPEEGKAYVELTSCNEQYFNAFVKLFAEYTHTVITGATG
jgi:S-adenosylmethionine decarboxylase